MMIIEIMADITAPILAKTDFLSPLPPPPVSLPPPVLLPPPLLLCLPVQ